MMDCSDLRVVTGPTLLPVLKLSPPPVPDTVHPCRRCPECSAAQVAPHSGFFSAFPSHPHKDTGLLYVKRAMRQNVRQAMVVPLSLLHFPCHITPLYRGVNIPDEWVDPTTDVMEQRNDTSYALNPFSSVLFHAMLIGAKHLPIAMAKSGG